MVIDRRPGPTTRVRVAEWREDTVTEHEDRVTTEEPMELRIVSPRAVQQLSATTAYRVCGTDSPEPSPYSPEVLRSLPGLLRSRQRVFDSTIGRLGLEIVQKAVMSRIGTVVAVGAPSSLAVSLAQRARLTVAGFVRTDRMVVYTGQIAEPDACPRSPGTARHQSGPGSASKYHCDSKPGSPHG